MKNTLVQYHGGGYDGCIWEWNFGYYDEVGEFFSLFHTGSLGCGTKKKMDEYLLDRKENSDYFLIDMENWEHRKQFAVESNPSHVRGVAIWMERNTDYEMLGRCDICGEWDCAADMIPECPEGCGGIVIQTTKLVCEDCHSMHTCAHCGEFYEDYEHYFPQECREGACEYCHENRHCGCPKETKVE